MHVPTSRLSLLFRRSIFTIAVCLVMPQLAGCLAAISRHGINDPGDSRHISQRSFSPEEMAWLKASTTIFFLKAEDEPLRAEFERAISRSWTLTPVQVVPFAQRAQFADRQRYSYFVISGEFRTVYVADADRPFDKRVLMTHHHYYLTLWRSISDTAPLAEGTAYCRIELLVEFKTQPDFTFTPGSQLLATIYDGTHFRNWSPGQLSLYLSSAQSDLEKGQRRWLYDELAENAELAKLKQSTLYIPDYALVKFNKYSGDESEHHDLAKLLRQYHYPYKVVSSAELNNIIATGPDPVYVFDYVRSSGDKFVSVFERGRGIVYRHYTANSLNLDDDDFDVF